MQITGHESKQVELFTPKEYWTLFEKKYHQDGQNLYRYCVNLST